MKKLILSLAFAGIIGAPALAAQEAEAPAKTPQEMLEELHKLMKKASDEMGELEKELAKASLDSPKLDVIAERVENLRKAMEEGRIDDLPEGLRKHIQDNPEEVARETGKSEEEVRKIAESNEELVELLKKNPELLKKLAENQSTMESILEKQQGAERKLEETLRKQGEAAEAAKQKVDESLEVAHALRQKGQGQGQGQPKNEGQESKDPRKGENNQNSQKPNEGAKEGYEPGEGEMDRNDETEQFERGQGAGAQFEKKGKDMGAGASRDGTAEPSKYKGFWKKWAAENAKKNEERKKKD